MLAVAVLSVAAFAAFGLLLESTGRPAMTADEMAAAIEACKRRGLVASGFACVADGPTRYRCDFPKR